MLLKIPKVLILATVLSATTATAQVMLGAFVPGDGFSRQEISDYNDVMPKPLAFVNIFSSFSHDWDHLYWQSTNIVAEGAMPLITWMPIDLDKPEENILPEILFGLHDVYLDTWADKLLAWINQYEVQQRPKIMLRFGHEFNGDWYAYGNSPLFYQAAWQYIHDKFNEAGVNDYVEWVWSPNTLSIDDYDDITAYYPGADYVDWTAIDGYNFGSNYSWTQWETFSEIYSDTYLTLIDNYPAKPVLIAEIGSAEESDTPNAERGQFGDDSDALQSKETWVSDFLYQLEYQFPAVRAIAWFNVNKELSWSLTGDNNTGLDAYSSATGSDYFTSNFLSAPTLQSDAGSAEKQTLEFELKLATSAYTEASDQVADYSLQIERLHETLRSIESDHNALEISTSEGLTSLELSKNDFYDQAQRFSRQDSRLDESRASFFSSRATSTNLLELHNNMRDAAQESQIQRDSAYEQFQAAKSRHHALRDVFLQRKAAYFDALDAATNNDTTITDNDLQLLQESFLEARENSTIAYENFVVERATFEQIANSLKLVLEQKSVSQEDSINARNALSVARDTFIATSTTRRNALESLVERREIFIEARLAYDNIKKAYAAKKAELDKASESLSELTGEYTRANNALLLAYNKLLTAQRNSSIDEPVVVQPPVLADNNSSYDNPQIQPAASAELATSRKLPSVLKIHKSQQAALTAINKPEPRSPETANRLAAAYRAMSPTEKANYVRRKMAIIDY